MARARPHEELNITTARDADFSSLAQRMRDEVVASKGLVLSPGLIGRGPGSLHRHDIIEFSRSLCFQPTFVVQPAEDILDFRSGKRLGKSCRLTFRFFSRLEGYQAIPASCGSSLDSELSERIGFARRASLPDRCGGL